MNSETSKSNYGFPKIVDDDLTNHDAWIEIWIYICIYYCRCYLGYKWYDIINVKNGFIPVGLEQQLEDIIWSKGGQNICHIHVHWQEATVVRVSMLYRVAVRQPWRTWVNAPRESTKDAERNRNTINPNKMWIFTMVYAVYCWFIEPRASYTRYLFQT